MKFFRNFILVCLLGLLYSSCVKKENYPDVPVITYNNFAAYYSGDNSIDSAILTINFTDGNGDIGYPSQQTNVSPDLYVLPLIYYDTAKSYGPWLINNNDSTIFRYNIPYITPAGNDKELSGIIKINTENFLQTHILDPFIATPSLLNLANPHKMEFKVWIYDRAGNESNVLITPVQNL